MGVKTVECSSCTWVIIAWSEIPLNTPVKVSISIYPTEKSLQYSPISGKMEEFLKRLTSLDTLGFCTIWGLWQEPVFIIWPVKIKESASLLLRRPRDGSYKYPSNKQGFSFLFILLSTERMREESIPVRLAGTFDTHCPFQLKKRWSCHSQRRLIIQKKGLRWTGIVYTKSG